ncbi:MAG: porin family protein [Saprospiraceae bacterium]|nr:porin family protein [Saprospiraceae bacterium]
MMNNYRPLVNRNILIGIFLLGFIYISSAQRGHTKKVHKRFSAGIIGGLTFSQLDGDNYTGYDYSSIFGGLKVSAFINEKLSFDVNFLLIRKGASIEEEEIEFRVSYPKSRFIHLDYAEIPLMLSLKPHGAKSKLYFEGGIALSRLIDLRIQENVRDFTDVSFAQIEPEIKSTDVSAVVGIGTKIANNIAIGTRFSYGLNKIYINNNPIYKETIYQIIPTQVFFLRNYYISANLVINVF